MKLKPKLCNEDQFSVSDDIRQQLADAAIRDFHLELDATMFGRWSRGLDFCGMEPPEGFVRI